MHASTKIGDYEVREPVVMAGVVRYAATHVVLPRRATIEILDASAPRSTAIRLLRHACILEALHHPGVPRMFECGMLDGRPWIARERSTGITLEEELRTRWLTAHEVLDVVEQVAAILAHAHARGVLHRDVSPSTLIRDPQRGDTFVLDGWSNACTLDTELPGPLRGTTRYRAPELIHDLPTDGRADVFALGMIALHALQGPHAADGAIEVQPTALAHLIGAMIADDLTRRPTASDVVAAVRAIRADSAAAPIEYASDDTEVVLLETPRAKPRWTPQWVLDQTAPHGIVEIMPRRRRNASSV